ncbi:phage tail protein I [Pseudomonas sp. Pseusp11]|uniref:phage tail protein I n=1 Tax=Pseudomonas sp. Pseusp11 TaxID=3243003 RepID=UPI0039B5B416
MNILPPHLAELERKIDAGTARIDAIPVRTETLWNPWTCPVEVLPWLAWNLSIDHWRASWPEQRQRAAVASSLDLHRIKGTLRAVEQALSEFDLAPKVTEWFDAVPPLPRGTFRLDLATDSVPITPELDARIMAALEQNKRASIHLATVHIKLEGRSQSRAVAASVAGEVTTIYPLQVTQLEQTHTKRAAAGVATMTENTTLYPLQATAFEQHCRLPTALGTLTTGDATTLYPLQPTLLEQRANPAVDSVGGDSGEQTTIYPLQMTELEQQAATIQSVGADGVELTTIYPLEV